MKKDLREVLKRMTSMIIAVAMILTLLPARAYAEGEEPTLTLTADATDLTAVESGTKVTFTASVTSGEEDVTEQYDLAWSLDGTLDEDSTSVTYELQETVTGTQEYKVSVAASQKVVNQDTQEEETVVIGTAEKTVTYLEAFTVSFTVDGEAYEEPQTVLYGKNAEPPVPTKENKAFDGWYTDAECKTAAMNASFENITADADFYGRFLDAVAQIGSTNYASIEDAMAAVESGGTIKLMADLSKHLETNKTFTLDLNEKTVKKGIEVKGGTLTVKNGTVSNTDGAGITANGGNVIIDGDETTVQGSTYGVYAQSGQIRIDKGTIIGDNKSVGKDSNNDKKVIIKGGKFSDNEGNSVAELPDQTKLVKGKNGEYYELGNEVVFDAGEGKIADTKDKEKTVYIPTGETFATFIAEDWPEANREGLWRFDKWLNGTNAFEKSSEVTRPITVVANYIEQVKVTFDGNGGTVNGETTVVIDKGEKIPEGKIPTVERSGYAFDYWMDEDEHEVDLSTATFSTNATLSAKWTKLVTITLKYECNNETIQNDKEKKNIRTDETYGGQDWFGDTVINGYTFQGWYSGDVKITGEDGIPESNTTIVAKYEPCEYAITYDPNTANGGTGTPYSDTVTYGEEVIKEVDDEKIDFTPPTGYKFKEWNTKKDGTGDSFVPGASAEPVATSFDDEDGTPEDVTLYAIWEETEYTLILTDPDGGNQNKSFSRSYTQNSNLSSLARFTRTGYDYCIWKHVVEDEVFYYSKDAVVSQLTNEDNGTVTLEAVWIDATPPEIVWSVKAKEESVETLIYTLTVTDRGTGLDTDTLKYRLDNDEEWHEVINYQVEAGRDQVLHVRCFDNAEKPETEVDPPADVIVSEGDKVYFELKSDPNEKETPPIKPLVIESNSPLLEVYVDDKDDQEDDDEWKNQHTITIVADDSQGANGEKFSNDPDSEDDQVSGLQIIKWELRKENNEEDVILSGDEKKTDMPVDEDDINNNFTSWTKDLIIDKEKISESGKYILHVIAYDQCGNKTEKEVYLFFDVTAPTIDVTANSGNQYLTEDEDIWYYNASDGQTITVTITDDKQLSSYEVTITKPNGFSDTSFAASEYTEPEVTKTWTLSELDDEKWPEGEYTITVTAQDASGSAETNVITTSTGATKYDEDGNLVIDNDDAVITSVKFVLDRTAPEATIAMSGGNQDGEEWYYSGTDCSSVISIETAERTAPIKTYTVTATDEQEKNVQWTQSDDTIHEDAIDEDLKEQLFSDGLEDGKITITVETEDWAGNTSSVILVDAENKEINKDPEEGDAFDAVFFFRDMSAPTIKVKMDGGNEVENKWYYRADNSDVTITIVNAASQIMEYTIELKPEKGVSLTRTMTTDENGDRKEDGDGISTIEEEGKKITITFTTAEEEVAALSDGVVTVTVSASNQAGTPKEKIKDVTNLKRSSEDEECDHAEFILDKTSPKLTTVKTDTKNGAKGLYKDENGYYYNDEPLATTFSVEDENLYKMLVTYKKNDEEQDPLLPDASGDVGTGNSGKPPLHTVKLEYDEGKYSEITITAYDKAGNPLVLGEKCITDESHDAVEEPLTKPIDDLTGNAGTVQLKYNKFVDRTAPTATLEYDSKATAYLYAKTDKQENDIFPTGKEYDPEAYMDAKVKAAYMNKKITTTLTIEDPFVKNYPSLHMDEIFFWRSNTSKKDLATGDEFSITDVITEDGRYFYHVYGTDRAGNALKVVEKLNASKNPRFAGATDKPEFEKEGCATITSFETNYVLVLDTIAPTYQYEVTTRSEDDETDETFDKSTVTSYLGSVNKSIKYTFIVEDTNLDYRRIDSGVASKKGTNFSYDAVISSEKIKWNKIKVAGENYIAKESKKGRYIYSDTVSDDGVYRFEIIGYDKAGNALVPVDGQKDLTVEYGSGLNEKSGGYWSTHMVLDTTKPDADLDFMNSDGKSYYHVDMTKNGNDLTANEPYRKETVATMQLSQTDASPVLVSYTLKSSIANDVKGGSNGSFETNGTYKTKVNGEQVISVNDVDIRDRAGNKLTLSKSNDIYLDVTPPVEDIDAPVATITATSAVTRRTAEGQDLFNRGISLRFDVTDPNSTARSSGLYQVYYTVTINGTTDEERKNIYDFGTKVPGLGETKTLDYTFSDDKAFAAGGKYESNDIVVTLYAVDNAGNASETKYHFGIDTTAPQILVTYDNNSAENEKYFKADRVATVVVTERNLGSDSNTISVSTQGSVSGSWNYAAGGSVDGNSDTWTKTISYTQDGDYTLTIQGTDALGNTAVVTYQGVAPQDFVLDKTAPVITITFDNNSVLNGKYYNMDRTATVSIQEHNFRASDATVNVGATIQRGTVTAPEYSAFTEGGDEHNSYINFNVDGNYTITASYTDLAGNAAVQAVVEEFVIDKTVPELYFEEGSVTEGMAYGSDIAPAIIFSDTNYSPDLVSYSFTGARTAEPSMKADLVAADDFGASYRFSNFEVTEESDDIYTLRATITDLAGNSKEISTWFSVNRFGSTFDYNNDDYTQNLVENKHYVQQPDRLQLREINVNELVSYTLTLWNNSNSRELKEGTDYTVQKNEIKGGYEYVYTINSAAVSEEGELRIVVQSEDTAGNKNTNTAVRAGGKTEMPVAFVVDRTIPTIQMYGADAEQKRFQMENLPLNFEPKDNQALAKVVITILDEDGNVFETLVYENTRDAKLLTDTLKENGGMIPYTLKEGTWTVKAQSFDAAGNESEIFLWEEVTVSSNLFVLYYHNKPLFIGSLAGLGALLGGFFLLLAKKKKKEEEGANA